MGELGTVDDDDGVGVAGERGVDRAMDPAHDARQPWQDRQRPHDGDIGQRKRTDEPLSGHQVSPHAGKLDTALLARVDRGH
jgi:hypothetical protein